MKVFVAGATGAIGRRAVDALVAAGHDVTGVARTDEKAALLESLGATPARVDLFDAVAVKDAVRGHDIVINLTTHIPHATRAAVPGAWKENDRIRREVSTNLVDAAIAGGATRYVQESIAFGYADSGGAWVDEQTPYVGDAYESVRVAEANASRFASNGGVGIVLRFGMFYDAESHTTVDMVRAAKLGRFALPGKPDAYASFIATEDAATAVAAALDAPTGTYNVVDDEPMTRAEIASILASTLGRPVNPLPTLATKAATARTLSEPLARSLRVSNAAFKRATTWTPSRPNLRAGLPPVVHQVLAAKPSRGSLGARVLLALLVPATFVTGVWGAFAPRSLYDDFPGFGLVWAGTDGPYNEHFIRDFGSLNLALAIVLAVAAWRGGRAWLTTAAGAYLAYGVPHLVYHLRHTDVIEGFARTSSLGALAMAVTSAVFAFLLAMRRPSTDAI